MKELAGVIAAVVEGDLEALPAVLAASHPELQAAAAELARLSVSRRALARVLNAWRSGHFVADDVQRWASFVRRGYVAGKGGGPITPIDIDYDAGDEDVIVEIIGRLDEIGDLVDGEVDDDERAEMLSALQMR